MNRLLILTFAVMTCGLEAQNLVPNPGFENYLACPTQQGQYRLAENWFSPGTGTPDYFNDCSPALEYGTEFNVRGGQIPYEGHAYMGFQSADLHHNEFYEYLEARLIQPLDTGREYCIRAYVSRGNSTDALPSLGAVLSVSQLRTGNSARIRVRSVTLSCGRILADTSRWMCITGEYRARGGEQFLTLGDFSAKEAFVPVERDPSLDSTFKSAYYFLDEVSVTALDSLSRCSCAKEPR
ncbi:MAG TPA: hypothetical protein VMC08_00955 [Bacteroidales bacterium]|nr:hypothetical protein [Bacteroidales bacterium]